MPEHPHEDRELKPTHVRALAGSDLLAETLRPLKARPAYTDRLIDGIVYQL